MTLPAAFRNKIRNLRAFLCSLVFFTINLGFSQTISLRDSLSYLLRKEPKPVIKLDSRNSFITGTSVRMLGVKAGYEFGERLGFGVGYQWLNSEHKRLIDQSSDDMISPTVGELKFNYFLVYGEYTFYSGKNWTVTVPAQIGIGRNYLVARSPSNDRKVHDSGLVWLYEPSMLVDYYFLRYFSLGGGFGYRLMLVNNKKIEDRFTAPTYTFRFRVFVGKLWRDLKLQ